LIKTLRGSELEILKNMLDDYIYHISVSTKNKSLLARIYGIFTIKNTGLRPINLIIMQNTSVLHKSKNKEFAFDLKGST